MIYIIQNSLTKNIKIGFTLEDPLGRLASLQTGSAEELDILVVIEGDVCKENALHKKFKKDRLMGEWFKPSDEVLAYIESIRPENLTKFTNTLKKRKRPGKIFYPEEVTKYRPPVGKYSDLDYSGNANIRKAERELILLAAHRFHGDEVKMAEALKITVEKLKQKLVLHALNNLDLTKIY